MKLRILPDETQTWRNTEPEIAKSVVSNRLKDENLPGRQVVLPALAIINAQVLSTCTCAYS
jgi:hypothetical protein